MRLPLPAPLPSARVSSSLALAGLLVGVLSGASACDGGFDPLAASGGTAGATGGVLLISIDGLRADHVGTYGYDRPTTPKIDAIAAEGIVFSQAFAPAPLALPSSAALLTGCDPIVSLRARSPEVGRGRWRLTKSIPRLAIEFLSAGYRTAAFVDGPILDPALGFDVGFQRYLTIKEDEVTRKGSTRSQVSRFLAWLRADRGPWFAFLQLGDLERSWSKPSLEHERYFQARPELDFVPPVGSTDDVYFAIPYSRWRRGPVTLGEYEASYDGHLRRLDEELGELFGGLKQLDRDGETTLLIVGSHGTQFGEAGLFLTSGGYSMADLSVPMILRPRAGVLTTRRGTIAETLASLVDVAPTLLAIEELPVPAGMHGLAQLDGSVVEREYVVASCGLQPGCGVIGPRYRLEYVAPGELDHGTLRRSWFGELREDQGAEMQVRVYERKNGLHASEWALGEGIDGARRLPEVQAMRALALHWAEHMQNTRAVLQGAKYVEQEVSEARIRELIEMGYLGEDAAD